MGGKDGTQKSRGILSSCSELGKHIRKTFYCYKDDRIIISYSCVPFGSNELKTMKHHVTTVYFQEKNIVLVQLMTHRREATEICLHQYICKNYLERKDITIMVQEDLLTYGIV